MGENTVFSSNSKIFFFSPKYTANLFVRLASLKQVAPSYKLTTGQKYDLPRALPKFIVCSQSTTDVYIYNRLPQNIVIYVIFLDL